MIKRKKKKALLRLKQEENRERRRRSNRVKFHLKNIRQVVGLVSGFQKPKKTQKNNLKQDKMNR